MDFTDKVVVITGAANGIGRAAAAAFAQPGARVPAVDRDLQMQMNPADPDAARASYEASIPVGRYGTAEEVANVVLFRCPDLASNVTGAQYTVDGGRTATAGAVTGHAGR